MTRPHTGPPTGEEQAWLARVTPGTDLDEVKAAATAAEAAAEHRALTGQRPAQTSPHALACAGPPGPASAAGPPS